MDEKSYSRGTEEERQGLLEQIAKETWTEQRPWVIPKGLYGHFYYPGQATRLLTDPTITAHGHCLDGITDPGWVYPHYEGGLLQTADLKRREKAKKVLALEYKIHLMPKGDYIPVVTRRLCELLRDDAGVGKSVAGFKVKLDPSPFYTDLDTGETETLPIIVVYPTLGKDKAQFVLDQMYTLFPDQEELGMNVTPRDNRQVNSLIYWAQSGGDLKKKYRRRRRRNTQFSVTGSHFLGDEHALQNPGKMVVMIPEKESTADSSLCDRIFGYLKRILEIF